MTDSRPIALITGGARRVGAAIGQEFARRGFDLIITYRTSADQAQAMAQRLGQSHGTRVRTVRCDLADPDAAARACANAASDAGRLDVLVHNASAYFPTPFDMPLPWETVRDLYAINAASPLLISAALAPLLTRSPLEGGGCVVAMGDMHAMGRPRVGFSAYGMSKAALIELVRVLARELAPNARAVGIAPGVVAWPESGYESDEASQQAYLNRVPLRRTGTPHDAARLAAALALDMPYVTGEVVRLDGGRWLA
ncbi:MAG: SDR family oxidoreductase [Phycisphaeraceae bacterium]|nr:SDR family oxidoreductase [Phycisphaeraceae bacterium]